MNVLPGKEKTLQMRVCNTKPVVAMIGSTAIFVLYSVVILVQFYYYINKLNDIAHIFSYFIRNPTAKAELP